MNKLFVLIGVYIIGVLTPITINFLNHIDENLEKNIDFDLYMNIKNAKNYIIEYENKNKQVPNNLNEYFAKFNIEFSCDIEKLNSMKYENKLNLIECGILKENYEHQHYYIDKKYKIYYKNMNNKFELSFESLNKKDGFYNELIYIDNKYIYFE